MFPARFSLRPAWPQQLDRQTKVFAFFALFSVVVCATLNGIWIYMEKNSLRKSVTCNIYILAKFHKKLMQNIYIHMYMNDGQTGKMV